MNKNKTFLIEADIKKVFEWFINPDKVKKWLGAHSAVIADCQNGPYSIGWDASEEGNFYCCSGKINKIVKNKTLVITDLNYFCEGKKFIGPIEIAFNFSMKKGFTEIKFKLIENEKGKSWNENFEAVFCSWEEAFYLLKKHLERNN